MQPGQPSLTAMGAALYRAAHQVLEYGHIFSDPLAHRILGLDAQRVLQAAQADTSSRGLRLFIAMRSRLAEDVLAAAMREGTRQIVVLGAGLDTYAYRATLAEGTHIYEVDHPATQAWKRERLASAGIEVPRSLTFAPIDFERQTLSAALDAVGYAADQVTAFTWLGVVPYLTELAILGTLDYIGQRPKGSQVIFDYANPLDPTDTSERARQRKALEVRVAALGEQLQSRFDTEDLHAKLHACGFDGIEDFNPAQLAAKFFPGHPNSAPERGAHVLRAVVGRR